ncbi:hypothetical protein [Daejeonella oryzae]|uniref:hypothetical protein n=1 Tax=Daejeonella oryzae TaxID=1122943 RepID=UPI0004213EAE|nr:hypothetical protein [Daejeonella oryzae]
MAKKNQMTQIKRLSIFSLIVFAPFFSLKAQETQKKPSPFRFLVKGALEMGGQDVAEVYFTDGSKQSVKTGQGGTLALGGELRIPGAEKFALQASAGYKYVTTKADNANIRLTRVPLSLTANWMPVSKFRFSTGLISHQAINFNADGVGENISFSPASGPVFEVAYNGIGLSYTSMTYKDQNKIAYPASALGLSITLTFPKAGR